MTHSLKTAPFASQHQDYDAWFEQHQAAYLSELLAVRALLPLEGRGLEIGVGTGRFAGPLGIGFGIDPVAEMLGHCQTRHVAVARAMAEALPFANVSFDYVLAVTAICFMNGVDLALQEAWRVLRPGGAIIIGFIDRESPLGQSYLARQSKSVFYCDAHFFSASEVAKLLDASGFVDQVWLQTLSAPLAQNGEIEPARPGTGSGAFLVVRAIKPQN